MTEPIPIVVCGQHAQIAEVVRNGLQPEYEGVTRSGL